MARYPTRTWIEKGWGYEVGNRDQLLRTIGRISTLREGRVYAWRGQSNAKWELSSSLYRRLKKTGPVDETRMRAAEEHIVKRARAYELGRELGSSNTDANLLATLQHHGVPTRLFDMTSNPMTALWFATEQPNEGNRNSGVLFAIDVTDMKPTSTVSYGAPTYGSMSDPLGWDYGNELADSLTSRKPFRLYPALPDERIKAQEGYFIAGAMPDRPSIDGLPDLSIPQPDPPGEQALYQLVEGPTRGTGRPMKLPFLALVIPPDVKDALRDPLKGTYNRRRRVLFPDVDGFREAFAHGEETVEDTVPADHDVNDAL